MVPLVRLAKSGIETSRLAFGTSRLHHMGLRERERLLSAAADFGIVHFDTAPAYGDGLAETQLGRFIAKQRDRFVIATKYGIPPDPLIGALPAFALPLRGARAVARRAGVWRERLPPLTAAGLRDSVEHSLRRLGTDRIDILFLHEPSMERLARVAELLEEFSRLEHQGLIRAFGLAGSWGNVGPVVAAIADMAQVVQTGESEWPAEFPPDISYGALVGGAQSYFSAAIDAATALHRLRMALARRHEGIVLVSTTKVDNLRQLAAAAEMPAP